MATGTKPQGQRWYQIAARPTCAELAFHTHPQHRGGSRQWTSRGLVRGCLHDLDSSACCYSEVNVPSVF